MLQYCIHKISAAGFKNPRRLTILLIASILQQPYEKLFLLESIPLTKRQKNTLTKRIERLLKGEPLSKIINQKEFYGRIFKTTRHTLDPRPDSERLIDAVLQESKAGARILDLGTGTGCLLITLLKEIKNSCGVGIDICPQALKVAYFNALQWQVTQESTWYKSNWLEKVNQKFDIIISNPPYIALGETIDKGATYDPKKALYAQNNGLQAYINILVDLNKVCHEGTKIFFEIGYQQAQDVNNLIHMNGFKNIRTIKDYGENDRVLFFMRSA